METNMAHQDDTVDFNSIIKNKEATKSYWENRMRENSQDETNKMSTNLATENHNGLNKSKTDDENVHEEKLQEIEDKEDDGGFDSFQTTDNSSDVGSNNEYSPSPDHGIGLGEKHANQEPQYKAQLTFSQSQQNIPEGELKRKANTVLDMINSEISELHMRELELKEKSKTNKAESNKKIEDYDNSEEEYNSDSAVDFESLTGTSNSGSATPSDRPRSAGAQTPSSEFEHNDKAEGKKHEVDVAPAETEMEETKVADKEVKKDETVHDVTQEKKVESSSEGKTQSPHKPLLKRASSVRPLVEEDEEQPVYNMASETSVEREIRIAREREEEFRKLKTLLSQSSVNGSEAIPVIEKPQIADKSTETVTSKIDDDVFESAKEPEQPSKFPTDAASEGAPKVKEEENKNEQKNDEKDEQKSDEKDEQKSDEKKELKKDFQYEMATARLKKEIEETLNREKELLREGRLKSVSSAKQGSVDNEEVEKTETSEVAEKSPILPDLDIPATERNILPSQGKKPLGRLSSAPKASPSPSPSSTARFFSPAGFASTRKTSVSSVTSPTTTPVRSLSISSDNGLNGILSPPLSAGFKPQFSSMERYLLKTSVNFSIGKRLEPLAQQQEEKAKSSAEDIPAEKAKLEETSSENGEEEETSPKPRRKYITAEDKIQKEFQEMAEREKELSQLRSRWKSTPNLSHPEAEEKSSVEPLSPKIEDKTKEEDVAEKPNEVSSSPRNSISESTNGNGNLGKMKNRGLSGSTYDVLENEGISRAASRPLKRKQSALISKWEDMIRQQQNGVAK